MLNDDGGRSSLVMCVSHGVSAARTGSLFDQNMPCYALRSLWLVSWFVITINWAGS